MLHHVYASPLRRRLLALVLFFPLGASANPGYIDYFFRDPAIGDTGLSNDFNQVLANVDRRNYQKASEIMDGMVAKVGASGLGPAANAQLLADAGMLKACVSQDGKAIPLLEQSVRIIEESVSRFSPLLFNPLMVEGMIQSRARDYPAAVELFRRAQHILHVQDGVYTRKQVPVLEQLTRVDRAQGKLLYADREQRFSLRIVERAYGDNNEALIPTLERVGNWFASRGEGLPTFVPDGDVLLGWLEGKVPGRYLGGSNDPFESTGPFSPPRANSFGGQIRYFRAALFDEAVDMYERAIRILEDKYGPNDLRLVGPLEGLARTRLLEGAHSAQSEEAMERAANIVANNPTADVEDRVEALVRLADLYTTTGDGRARERYLDAWDLLSQHPELKMLKTRLFGEPRRLYPEAHAWVLDRRPLQAAEGAPLYATLRFTVDEKGMPRDLEVTGGNVPQSNRNILAQYFRKVVKYRPRIVDGKVVSTNGVEFRQTFVTLTAAPAQPPAAASQVAKTSKTDS